MYRIQVCGGSLTAGALQQLCMHTPCIFIRVVTMSSAARGVCDNQWEEPRCEQWAGSSAEQPEPFLRAGVCPRPLGAPAVFVAKLLCAPSQSVRRLRQL